VPLIHSCAFWLHLEGDENWMGRDQQEAGRSEQWGQQGTIYRPPQGLLALALGPCHGPTCNSELDMGTDLALWPVGGNAGVVASIISGHSGKV
jgi:hypothetical protein